MISGVRKLKEDSHSDTDSTDIPLVHNPWTFVNKCNTLVCMRACMCMSMCTTNCKTCNTLLKCCDIYSHLLHNHTNFHSSKHMSVSSTSILPLLALVCALIRTSLVCVPFEQLYEKLSSANVVLLGILHVNWAVLLQQAGRIRNINTILCLFVKSQCQYWGDFFFLMWYFLCFVFLLVTVVTACKQPWA